ncbi:MAG: S8 family serine peptidase [Anaerolineae bacterium]|nr:S8 family serine peptidase [Anaerolineae bacterium]
MKNIPSKLISRLTIVATLASAPMVTTLQATYAASPQREASAQNPLITTIPDDNPPTNQIIVKYKAGVSVVPSGLSQVNTVQTAAGAAMNYGRAMSGDAHVMRLGASVSASDASTLAARIAALPEVEYAHPDFIAKPTYIPNDTLFSQQWHYFTPTVGTYGINLPSAWDVTKGDSSIVIAVLDTGILPHPDLAGRTVPGYDFITDVTTAQDGNGRDSDPTDPGDYGCGSNSSWHGTHVAGTIGALSNNGSGVAGVNHVSKILPVRVLGRCGGYTSDIVDAIRWSAGLPVSGIPNNANPAKVINMSLGGGYACSSAPSYQSAIDAATAAGATVVVAAGNSNSDASGFSPASCNRVITVASTGRTGSRAYYSNYGATVEISAPGGDMSIDSGVLSTLNAGTTTAGTHNYVSYQGTSMATPHVAGVVSLMLSLKPSMNYTQVVAVLQSTATAFPGGSTCTTSICGPGIVNAFGALQQAGKMAFGVSNGTGNLGTKDNIVRVSTASPVGVNTGIAGVQFNVAYPDNLGVKMSNIRTTARTSGYTVISNTVQSGGVFTTSVLLYSASAAAIAAGSGPVLEFLLDVSASPTATAGTTVPLSISNLLLADTTGTPIQTEITTTNPVFNITALRRGDINSDVNVNVQDLTILRNMILSSPQPNPSYASDWWTRGDLNSDSTWNILDMIIEVRLVMGLPVASMAKQADGNSERITSQLNTNKVSLATVNAMPGTSGSMKVHLSNETNIAGLQLNLAYDATRGLKLTNVRRVGRSGEAGTTAWAVSDENSAQAKVTALWYGVNGEALSAGDGDMLLIDYEVAANATGPISVDISQAILAGERADALPIQVESGKVIVGGNAANALPSAER